MLANSGWTILWQILIIGKFRFHGFKCTLYKVCIIWEICIFLCPCTIWAWEIQCHIFNKKKHSFKIYRLHDFHFLLFLQLFSMSRILRKMQISPLGQTLKHFVVIMKHFRDQHSSFIKQDLYHLVFMKETIFIFAAKQGLDGIIWRISGKSYF